MIQIAKLLKKTLRSLGVLICISLQINAQNITTPEPTEVWEPVPKVVTVENENWVPSDAIILFDGTSLDHWESAKDGSSAQWKVENGIMTVVKGTGDIQTKENFGSCQLHLEWRTPAIIEGEGQGRGNSGVFFQNRYEVQVLDNYNNKTYPNGQAASVYKQYIPLVNACRAPGEWQEYDIIFEAPVFNADGVLIRPGYLTVFHNGVLVQNHVELKGTTEYIGLPKNIAHGEDKIKLQDHSNPVSYRNIWIRKL